MPRIARLGSLFALAMSLVLVATPARAEDTRVRLLSASGMIDAVAARYLVRELGRAEADGVAFAIVELDTPGGAEPAMREMVRSLLGARVPVVVYVAPSGARAASAGMFVTMAASVAAMAPGTEIGAAHPVVLGGMDPVMDAKIVSDAAAFARAVGETRHRNGLWAERAVLESVSLTADEARREGVVDVVARDLPDLLAQLDGRSVATAAGERTLHTEGVRFESHPMAIPERIVQAIGNPNLAYLLFLLGLLGLAAELYHPGTFVPATLGAVSLVLALVGFGNLPISWAGVGLLVFALGLFVAELHTGVGAFAVAAVVALVAGSLLLYRPPGPVSPTAAAVHVSPWLVVFMSGTVASFFLVVVRATLRARHLAVRTGVAALVGQTGIAVSELAPTGTVRVGGEVWTADAGGTPIQSGDRVVVVGASGVTLRVTLV